MVLSNIKLGPVTFRAGVPYWTVVPPVILRRGLPDVKDKFGLVSYLLKIFNIVFILILIGTV